MRGLLIFVLALAITFPLRATHAAEAPAYVDDATHARLTAEHQAQSQLINILLEVTAWRAKHGTPDYPSLETMLAEQNVLPMPEGFNWGFPDSYNLVVRNVKGSTCTFIAAPVDSESGFGTFAITEKGSLLQLPASATFVQEPGGVIVDPDVSTWEVVALPELPPPSISDLEFFAIQTLRALGSAQVSYRDQSPDKSYGSWRELQETQFLQVIATADSIVPGYHLTLTRNGRDDADTGERWFRLLAVPVEPASPLRAFVIDETQQVLTGPAPNPLTEAIALNFTDWTVVTDDAMAATGE